MADLGFLARFHDSGNRRDLPVRRLCDQKMGEAR